MMERYDHSNPWAEKLQDVGVPEVNSAWQAMEALLDQEMPVRKWKDGRRWALLIILLLLLIGVCNCPGRGRFFGERERTTAGQEKKGGVEVSRDKGDTVVKLETGGTGEVRQNKEGGTGERLEKEETAHLRQNNDGDTIARLEKDGTGQMRQDKEEVIGVSGKTTPVRQDKDRTTEVKLKKEERTQVRPGKNGTTPMRLKKERATQVRQDKDGRTRVSSKEEGDTRVSSHNEEITQIREEKKVTTLPDTVAKPGMRSGKPGDTLTRPGKIAAHPRRDSTRRDNNERRDKNDTIVDVKGWMAGIGLNQFFTVGQQQRSGYNSSGTTGGLGDYIPVPMVRYYFSRKLFVQMEAQLNTPQYIKRDLVGSKSAVDTTIPTIKSQNVTYIKKLFYFNVPLSVHYSPVKNIYLGAGIQFSRLTNGVGVAQNKLLSIAGTDSTIVSTKVVSLKSDTVYQKIKTNEFRLLLDLDYTYKKVIVGVRYNQALSKFLNVRISDTEITQGRNSSLQVYLRYILWDGRKKKLFTK